jgi:hypothetical protein
MDLEPPIADGSMRDALAINTATIDQALQPAYSRLPSVRDEINGRTCVLGSDVAHLSESPAVARM